MAALACGELHIPCLTRVPASETTATGMGRMSALLQRKNCGPASSPLSGAGEEGGEPGESH